MPINNIFLIYTDERGFNTRKLVMRLLNKSPCKQRLLSLASLQGITPNSGLSVC
jgi:hypothetical protein